MSTEAWGAEAANGLLNPSPSLVLSQRLFCCETNCSHIGSYYVWLLRHGSYYVWANCSKYLVKTLLVTLLYMTSSIILGVRWSHSPGWAWVVAVWNTKIDQSGILHWVHGLEMSWYVMKCLRSSCCSVVLRCFAAKKTSGDFFELGSFTAPLHSVAKECERGFRPFAPDCQAACFNEWCLVYIGNTL